MDWFLMLLAAATAVRGLGAGLICDVAWISLPLRRRIGAVPYARYARANFNSGFKTYGPVSILGALLMAAVGLLAGRFPPAVFRSGMAAAVATIPALFGTSRALPALMAVRRAPDDEVPLAEMLARFARWHSFSAAWQVLSFLALVVALAFYRG